MLKPINSIIKDSIGNIIYRGNVVTGTVAVDNGDGSYDVFISESDRAYPKIFTLSANPDLAVEDKVRILYQNGCKELPIILPPVTTIPLRYALIVASPNELQLFNMDGALVKQVVATGWAYAGCSITVGSQGNIYTDEDYDVLKKYDSNLNLLVTQNIESGSNWFEGINMGSNGYLYTLEGIASGYDIKKRSTTDLTIVETIPITTDVFNTHSGGICLDSNGNFYCVGDNDDICKYSSSGALLASIDVGSMSYEYAGCGVLGNYVYFVKDTNEVFYLPLDLSSYAILNLPSNIAYALTVADGHLILTGWDGDGDGATSKYDSNRNLIWTVKLTAASYGYKAGGYNF